MDSAYYQNRYRFTLKRQKVWRAITEYLSVFVPTNSTVLELGVGYGDFINNIKANKKIAIDLDLSAKQYCHPEVEFFNVNALDMNIDSSSIDIVFASNFLEHFDDEELKVLLPKIHACLKKEGKLILIQPNYYYAYREYWDDYTHKKAFSHHSITDFLIAEGFEISLVKKKFLPFSFKSHIPQSYFLTKLYLNFFWKPFAKQMLVVAKKV